MLHSDMDFGASHRLIGISFVSVFRVKLNKLIGLGQSVVFEK